MKLLFLPLSVFLPFYASSLLIQAHIILFFYRRMNCICLYTSSAITPVSNFHINSKQVIGLQLLTPFPLFLSFISKVVRPVVIQPGTSPLVTQSCRCDAILSFNDKTPLITMDTIGCVHLMDSVFLSMWALRGRAIF